MKQHNAPAVRTPEFWLTLLSQALPLLAILGVLLPEELERLQQLAEAVVENGFVFVQAALALGVWIYARVQDLNN